MPLAGCLSIQFFVSLLAFKTVELELSTVGLFCYDESGDVINFSFLAHNPSFTRHLSDLVVERKRNDGGTGAMVLRIPAADLAESAAEMLADIEDRLASFRKLSQPVQTNLLAYYWNYHLRFTDFPKLLKQADDKWPYDS